MPVLYLYSYPFAPRYHKHKRGKPVSNINSSAVLNNGLQHCLFIYWLALHRIYRVCNRRVTRYRVSYRTTTVYSSTDCGLFDWGRCRRYITTTITTPCSYSYNILSLACIRTQFNCHGYSYSYIQQLTLYTCT